MAFKFTVLLAYVSVSIASAQFTGFNLDFNLNNDDLNKPSTTPVPILRYIDTQNPDGSYTFGYESGDGTYKIETRYATGEVKGKYGYYDDAGVLREVEYGATPTGGFNPSGNGLEIPDTPVVTTTPAPEAVASSAINGRRVNVVRRRRPQEKSQRLTNDQRVLLPKQRRQGGEIFNRNLPIRPARTTTTPRPVFQERPVQPQQPVQPVFVPQQPLSNSVRFDGHPAQNIDLKTGSYTIAY